MTDPRFIDVAQGDGRSPASACAHCRDGWFAHERFGTDVECVNGVLIDIDEAHEGWMRDVAYPVAPCHPMWERQQRGEDFPDDSQERLNAWAASGIVAATAGETACGLDERSEQSPAPEGGDAQPAAPQSGNPS